MKCRFILFFSTNDLFIECWVLQFIHRLSHNQEHVVFPQSIWMLLQRFFHPWRNTVLKGCFWKCSHVRVKVKILTRSSFKLIKSTSINLQKPTEWVTIGNMTTAACLTSQVEFLSHIGYTYMCTHTHRQQCDQYPPTPLRCRPWQGDYTWRTGLQRSNGSTIESVCLCCYVSICVCVFHPVCMCACVCCGVYQCIGCW